MQASNVNNLKVSHSIPVTADHLVASCTQPGSDFLVVSLRRGFHKLAHARVLNFGCFSPVTPPLVLAFLLSQILVHGDSSLHDLCLCVYTAASGCVSNPAPSSINEDTMWRNTPQIPGNLRPFAPSNALCIPPCTTPNAPLPASSNIAPMLGMQQDFQLLDSHSLDIEVYEEPPWLPAMPSLFGSRPSHYMEDYGPTREQTPLLQQSEVGHQSEEDWETETLVDIQEQPTATSYSNLPQDELESNRLGSPTLVLEYPPPPPDSRPRIQNYRVPATPSMASAMPSLASSNLLRVSMQNSKPSGRPEMGGKGPKDKIREPHSVTVSVPKQRHPKQRKLAHTPKGPSRG